MKNLIITLIILLSSSLCMAQFSQGAGIEYNVIDNVYLTDPVASNSLNVEKGEFTIMYQLRYELKGLEVSSLAKIWANKTPEDYTFSPTHSEYVVSIAYKFKKFKVGATHTCYHPLITDRIQDRVRMTGSSTKIGIYYNIK